MEGASEAPWSRTCARWYLLSPEVQEVLVWLEDYRRGRLGTTWEFELPLLAALRTYEAEERRWQDKQFARRPRGSMVRQDGVASGRPSGAR